VKVQKVHNVRTNGRFIYKNVRTNERLASLSKYHKPMNDYKKHWLAYEIATQLNDLKSIGLHIHFTNINTEAFLREQLALVLATPDSEISKSRAAYYVHLVKTNGKNPRH
jgi:hypothetical protein